jgi:hypothetical protein
MFHFICYFRNFFNDFLSLHIKNDIFAYL